MQLRDGEHGDVTYFGIMRRVLPLLLALPLAAADLPPDKGAEIPASGKRPVVVSGRAVFPLPKHDLPPGYTLELAAAAPLVTHPIMGCLDDRGRLFVGDAVGVNWNKKQLEENPPNRVLMLEDMDRDGAFDKSTVFADKMTFPQGACWLNGSLYVCSPPGLWKLTDTNNDGIADEREMIVGGFEYTGNAADVHGPFLHPNGRLYWCHGRKGHKVVQKDGTPVDESMACGIWSCRPDGSDVAWHSLGCGDNPVEVDFTSEGDIIGVQNLYYSQPRGDTIIHWLYGGVYERPDQLKAIAHLPRTLETMPVMYNFGHVAVSGACFWHAFPTANSKQRTENFMVTHFNTQRLVRMELTPEGSTYKAVENEFLKLHNPDIHLTDVMEDPRDGSLLLLDTGGWFRIGCPASLMAKSDLLGAVYRVVPVRLELSEARAPSVTKAGARDNLARMRSGTSDERRQAGAVMAREIVTLLQSGDSFQERAGCDLVAELTTDDCNWIALNEGAYDRMSDALWDLMEKPLPPAAEHAVMNAYFRRGYDLKNQASSPLLLRRILRAQANHRGGYDKGPDFYASDVALVHVGADDPELARAALQVVIEDPGADKYAMVLWDAAPNQHVLAAMETFILKFADKPETQKLIAAMLGAAAPALRATAVRGLAEQTAQVVNDTWLPLLDRMLADGSADLPLLFRAIKKLKTSHFDAALQAIANDSARSLTLRLKALDAVKSVKLTGETFEVIKGVLADASSSSAAKIQAAGMIAAAPLQKPQVLELAPLFASVGPVELKALLPIIRKHKDADTGRVLAVEMAKNPVIASQQESAYRTAFSDQPPEIFESIILPAYNAAVAATEVKKRQLSPLAEQVVASGNAARGEQHFKTGKGTCIACHKIGDTGRPIGPDLSHIGAIRTERDLLESILFPSNTLARDYEAHVIETSDGQQTLGVIKSHAAEGLVVLDIAGQEKTIAHQTIVGDTTLTTSLMPMGLDQTMSEAELLDLVAWLRSLK